MDWYEDQEKKLKAGIFPVQDARFGGYAARRATHIKKIAMCFSASRNNEIEITLGDFEKARRILEKAERNMSKVFKGMGKSKIAELMDKVLSVVKSKKQIKRSEVLRFLYGDIDIWTLEQVERVLVGMKIIEVIILNEEQDALYKYTG